MLEDSFCDFDIRVDDIGALTPAKAAKMLRDRSWKGEKQRKYFGWVASGKSRHYGDEDIDTKKQIISLLNKRTKVDSFHALRLLESLYLNSEGDYKVGLEFSSCSDKTESKMYPPFRTGYANGARIHICTDSLGRDFNSIHSKQIRYDPKEICHYTAVFLHEFAHVLDKRGVDSFYGNSPNPERRADAFAQHFIDNL